MAGHGRSSCPAHLISSQVVHTISAETQVERLRNFVFRPAVVLSCSLLAAATYAVAVVLRNPEAPPVDHLLYVAPLIVPFVAFWFDRIESLRTNCMIVLGMDLLIVFTALARSAGHVPLVSGLPVPDLCSAERSVPRRAVFGCCSNDSGGLHEDISISRCRIFGGRSCGRIGRSTLPLVPGKAPATRKSIDDARQHCSDPNSSAGSCPSTV